MSTDTNELLASDVLAEMDRLRDVHPDDMDSRWDALMSFLVRHIASGAKAAMEATTKEDAE